MQDILQAITGPLPPSVELILVIVLATLANIFAWFVGRGAAYVGERFMDKELRRFYLDMRQNSLKTITFALLLCWVPLGSILALVAGGLKSPPSLSFTLIATGQAAFYVLTIGGFI
jgi:membrane protein YqaA with SNARE-associated domain